MVKRIAIEGNLAAGKSTLLDILKLLDETHMYEIAPEPVAQWQRVVDSDAVVGEDLPHELDDGEKYEDTNILSLFYKDPKRWAHTFQLYAFSSRLRHQRWQPHSTETKYLFMERSMESDKRIFARNCYMTGLMNRVEYAIYNDLHSYWTENAPKLDAIVYLRTSPETCYGRLVGRHRGEEMSITVDYLRHIHDRHQEWLEAESRVPVFVIDNEDILSDERAREIQTALLAFLSSIE